MCHFHCILVVRQLKILFRFKGKRNRSHLLQEIDKDLKEHVGLEILLWPSLENKICHTWFDSTWLYFPLWWRTVREWATMKCIQQPRTLERKHVCKNSLSLFVSFNSAILYTTKIVHYISGIYKLWGVCVCVCVLGVLPVIFCFTCLLLPWAMSSQPEILEMNIRGMNMVLFCIWPKV